MEDFSYKQHLVRSSTLVMSYTPKFSFPLYSHYDFMCTPPSVNIPIPGNPVKDIEDQVKVGERSSHHRVRAAWASIIPWRSRRNQHMEPQCINLFVDHKSLKHVSWIGALWQRIRRVRTPSADCRLAQLVN